MTFILQISVPIESNEYTGADHLPTLQVYATSEEEAERKVESLLKHLPDGTIYSLFSI